MLVKAQSPNFKVNRMYFIMKKHDGKMSEIIEIRQSCINLTSPKNSFLPSISALGCIRSAYFHIFI